MNLDHMTFRRQPMPASTKFRTRVVVLLVAGSVALSGCSLLPFGNEGSSPAPSTSPAAPAPGENAQPEAPKTPAQEFSTKLAASLGSLATTTKSPNRDQIRAAMVEAGANNDTLEISVDITPTGLAVDAIEAADVVDGECVVGQVREGQVAVSLLPVLNSGRCFVGDIH
ncbi:hypothetical protein ART_1081 [Arthrobacter sp. PAMC 25486]|uniref:DUF6993 domain-containing protein n=1 Tax=Arthrobacter sp. PAMC 25486 TaxID=1494608 RepID=UPI000535B80F|nr:hypothetical protein [Arthrobacter sp. PAMC 25486]AIY00680.1 hypothetical protein ART_1081 [Arthrobacter sp. PAMC 25486]